MKLNACILEEAADLISPEGGWTRGALARDSNGDPTETLATDAVSFCAVGAIMRCRVRFGRKYDYIIVLQDYLGVTSIGSWNDAPERTQAEVVSALRAAAISLRETIDE